MKSEIFKGQKIYFKRDKEIVMASSGAINKYDGKPKYFDFGATKKEAFQNIKKQMR